MKILLTGATGYIGKRLLPTLVEKDFKVICCVRDASRFNPDKALKPNIEIIEVDFLDKNSLVKIPQDIDGAYYLLHSMSSSSDYEELEMKCACNFRDAISKTNVRHVIYLSGIVNEDSLSRHLSSRKAVESELAKGSYAFTTLRAGIIIGSGSASFEIIRDLVEKLPVMITPKWLNTRCQPIGINDVVQFLLKSLFHELTMNKNFDIGGPDVLSYKEILLGFAKVRGLKRYIYTIPVMTPRLSSYWLYFVTSTSFKLATALVSSMKVEVICKKSDINAILDVQPMDYETALRKTLYRIEENNIISSWKDAWVSGRLDKKLELFLKVPDFGCFIDCREMPLKDKKATLDKIWQIGGSNGWYYNNWLWKIRGYLDKLFGGVGLRRGRTHPHNLASGDAIDFWRVLYANRQEGHLLLFAEMRLPGEAWLEFKLSDNYLQQTTTFRPTGLLGRIYWYALWPFHSIVFKGLLKKLAHAPK